MIFRYSGSKRAVIDKLPPPPDNVRVIVEPFAGSAAYALAHRPKAIVLCERNNDVYAMWQWLISTATTKELKSLARVKFVDKTDVRDLKLDPGPQTLLRLTCAGLMVGQLSSWKLYRQHNVDFSLLASALPYLQSAVVLGGRDFRAARACRR